MAPIDEQLRVFSDTGAEIPCRCVFDAPTVGRFYAPRQGG